MENSMVGDISELVEKSMILTVDGNKYSPISLTKIVDSHGFSSIEIKTLDGFIEFVKNSKDVMRMKDCFIAINSHKEVELLTNVKEITVDRACIIRAKLDETGHCFNYGSFLDHEDFIIKLKSLFLETEDQKRLLSYASKLTINNSINVEDDGVTQSAVIKKDASGALKDEKPAPSIVELKPFRTFREVDQPISQFLFRLRAYERQEPTCALFEADGGAWKIKAIKNIENYLKKKLPEMLIIA